MSTPEQLAAWKYHKRGWSIFPCRNKIPINEALKPDATGKPSTNWLWECKPTDEDIIRWWKQYPNAQIAVACGKLSGVCAIDIDSKTDRVRYPDHVLVPPRELADTYGLQLTTNTGGGGHHLIFKYKDEYGHITNSVKNFHPQIDLRFEKSYIILPPSTHHETLKRYEWARLVDESNEPFDLPEAFLERSEAIQKTGTDWNQLAKGVGEGSRNNTAAQLTGKLLQFMDEETSWKMLKGWNNENKPPLPEAELWSVFENILKRSFIRKVRL
jgi:hypothetical protein